MEYNHLSLYISFNFTCFTFEMGTDRIHIYIYHLNIFLFSFSVIFVNNFAFGPQVDHQVIYWIFFSYKTMVIYSSKLVMDSLQSFLNGIPNEILPSVFLCSVAYLISHVSCSLHLEKICL